MQSIAPGTDIWELDNSMLDALARRHRAMVAEAQIPTAALCHMFAASKGVEGTSPLQFLAYPPERARSMDSGAMPDGAAWRAYFAAYKRRHGQRTDQDRR